MGHHSNAARPTVAAPANVGSSSCLRHGPSSAHAASGRSPSCPTHRKILSHRPSSARATTVDHRVDITAPASGRSPSYPALSDRPSSASAPTVDRHRVVIAPASGRPLSCPTHRKVSRLDKTDQHTVANAPSMATSPSTPRTPSRRPSSARGNSRSYNVSSKFLQTQKESVACVQTPAKNEQERSGLANTFGEQNQTEDYIALHTSCVLTRQELAEVQKIAISPPASIRRVLAATWVALNRKSFRDGRSIQFNEQKKNSWGVVQKMLWDYRFASRLDDLLRPGSLDGTPYVAKFLADKFLGWPPNLQSKESVPRLDVAAVAKTCFPLGTLAHHLTKVVWEHLQRPADDQNAMEMTKEYICTEPKPERGRHENLKVVNPASATVVHGLCRICELCRVSFRDAINVSEPFGAVVPWQMPPPHSEEECPMACASHPFNSTLRLVFYPGQELPYTLGATVWCSAQLVSQVLEKRYKRLGRIIELGAGTGALGLALAKCAELTVLTDGDQKCVDLCSINAAVNSIALDGRKVDVRLLSFGSGLVDEARFDMVVASDVIYNAPEGSMVPGLLQSVDLLLSPMKYSGQLHEPVFILGNQHRNPGLMSDFVVEAERHCLEVEEVAFASSSSGQRVSVYVLTRMSSEQIVGRRWVRECYK